MTISNQSAGLRPGVCTSSTRPVTPYDGQVIYETDTDKTLVWNGSAWVYLSTSTANPPGLELVRSVTIGSGVATVNVTSCFNANYDDYRVVISNTDFSASTAALGLLLSGTTPTSSGWYGSTIYFVSGSATINSAALSNSAFFEVGSVSANTNSSMSVDIRGPFLSTVYTRTNFTDADDNYWRIGAHCHRANASYDGFQLSSYGGTYTGGTINVYGYKK